MKPGENIDAATITEPAFFAAQITQALVPSQKEMFWVMVAAYREIAKDSSPERLEALLRVQANALNALFGVLAATAIKAGSIEEQKQLLGLAFKAQKQTIETIGTLARLKAPEVTAGVAELDPIARLNALAELHPEYRQTNY